MLLLFLLNGVLRPITEPVRTGMINVFLVVTVYMNLDTEECFCKAIKGYTVLNMVEQIALILILIPL